MLNVAGCALRGNDISYQALRRERDVKYKPWETRNYDFDISRFERDLNRFARSPIFRQLTGRISSKFFSCNLLDGIVYANVVNFGMRGVLAVGIRPVSATPLILKKPLGLTDRFAQRWAQSQLHV